MSCGLFETRAGEWGSSLSANRPLNRQPQGLFRHWHSLAWQLERIAQSFTAVQSPGTNVKPVLLKDTHTHTHAPETRIEMDKC